MADHNPLEPIEVAFGDADARNGGEPPEETVVLTKPRGRSPTTSRLSQGEPADKNDEQASSGRSDRARGTSEGDGTVRCVIVNASDLLEQLGELTERLARTRVALETAGGERDALAVGLDTERRERGDAERRATMNQSALTEAEQQLARERTDRVELETALEETRRQNDEIRRLLLNLGWNGSTVPGSHPPSPRVD